MINGGGGASHAEPDYHFFMHPLREDYQVPFERDLAQAVKQHTHVLGVSPGGTGKTTTFSHIAVKAAAKGRSVIILTHRLSIFDQNLIGSCGIALNAETDKSITIQLGKVYVIMAQTIKFRPEWIEQFNTLPEKVLIIIDEAHDGGFCTILDKLTNRLTIGFTATPNYKDAKHLPLYYNALVETKPNLFSSSATCVETLNNLYPFMSDVSSDEMIKSICRGC